MKLHGYWRSSAAYRVRIALELKSIPHEQAAVHLLRDGGEQRRESYLRLNPGGRVPTLEMPDGQVLVQSMAILEWLEETYPRPPLLPAEPYARARVRGIAQSIVSDIQPLQNLSVTEYLRDDCGWTPEQVGAWLHRWVGSGMAAVERMLQASPPSAFCVGDSPTLADACLVPQCYAARRFGIDPAAYPRIAAVEARCVSMAAFAAAAPERQPDAPPAGG
jgi:maleylacetoacetate isomerase